MSGGICETHTPQQAQRLTFPARVEKLTERIYFRALDQYEKILDLRRTKKSTNTPSAEKCDPQDKRRPVGPDSALPSLHGLKRWRRNGSGLLTNPANHTSERLQYLAINALELTAPASDILLTSRGAHWFQVSGHPDSLAPAGPGTVWKRRCGPEDAERRAYEALSNCPHMKNAIPKYYREVTYKGDNFIELQDLLYGFQDPHVMDIKMGTRTFLESEVSKTIARSDLYEKMISVNPDAPTEAEHKIRAVTKLRYMQFREQQSSTNSEGFRIEGIKLPSQPPIKDLKKIKTQSQVVETIKKFLGARPHIRQRIVSRLKDIRTMFENCEYFKTHEVVGSSIFMIFDENSIGAWLIDFAKTNTAPEGIRVTHRAPWKQGNYEEGFLYGLDRLIMILENAELDNPPAEDITPIVER